MRQRDTFDKRAACEGKVRHETAAGAERQARWTGHGRPYRCGFCGGWHIGNAPTNQSKRPGRFTSKADPGPRT